MWSVECGVKEGAERLGIYALAFARLCVKITNEVKTIKASECERYIFSGSAAPQLHTPHSTLHTFYWGVQKIEVFENCIDEGQAGEGYGRAL